MNVIVTGTLSFDYIMDFSGRFADRIMPEKIHNVSLSFLVDTLHKQFGGTAGNIAYTLRLLGLDPQIISPGGSDFAPYTKHLKKHRVSTKYISIQKNALTSLYFVLTDTEDNQIGSFFLGATKYAKNLTLKKAVQGETFAVLSANEPVAMKRYVKECKILHIPYMYDPSFQIANFSPEELRDGIVGAKIVIGNDYEIALMERKLEISHEELVTLAPIVITTLGRRGSIIETRRDAIHIKPAKPKSEIDPTGAGDAYRAGLVAGYLRGYDLAICGQMGSTAAVYTVELYGTQTHEFSKKEFIARYKQNFGKTIDL